MDQPRLTLIPGGATVSPLTLPERPVAPPAPTRVGLDAEAMLGRLTDHIVALQTPDVPLPAGDRTVVVAVFDADAIPDLAGLLLQGRAEP